MTRYVESIPLNDSGTLGDEEDLIWKLISVSLLMMMSDTSLFTNEATQLSC